LRIYGYCSISARERVIDDERFDSRLPLLFGERLMALRSSAKLCFRVFLSVTLASWLSLAYSATDTWSGGGGDNNFRTPANWVGGVAPSPGDILAFDGEVRLTPNNNYVAGTQFGGITFTPTVAGPFTLNGSLINLTGNITDSTQAFTNTINLPLSLQTTPTVNVTQFGSLTISGKISGAFGLNETGSGVLTLSGGNTFTGPVTVGNGATLSVATDANLGATPTSPTPGNIVLNGGATLLTTGSNFTLNANRGISVVNNGGSTPPTALLNITSSQTVTYDGVISDNGTIGGITKLSFGSLTLGGTNTYTGATIVGNGLLTLDFNQTGAPVTNIISSSSTLNMGTASGANAGLGDTSNDRVLVNGKAGTANSQTFNGTSVALGPAVFQATSGASGGSATLNLGALSHIAGGTGTFILPTSGAITTSTANTNGILGGWATMSAGTLQNGVYQPTAWAMNDGTGKIVPYTAYTTLPNSGVVSGQVLASSTASNVNLPIALTIAGAASTNGSNTVTVGAVTGGTLQVGMYLSGNGLAGAGVQGYLITAINGSTVTLNSAANATATAQTWTAAFPTSLNSGTTDINTLKIEPGRTMIIGAGNTLRLGQFGGIMRTDTTIGTSTNYIGTPGVQDVGTLTAGGAPNTPGEIVFNVGAPAQTSGSLQVENVIADNGTGAVTVVKTGTGSMKIRGHDTFSGGLYIEAGRLQFAGAEIGTKNPNGGGTGPIYVFPGAQFFPSGAGSATDPGTISNPLFLAGVGINGDNTGAIRMGGGLTLSGLITLTGNARIGGGAAAFVNTTNGTIQPGTMISGKITGNFGMDFGSAGNPGGAGNTNWISNPANDWHGDTTIVGRTGGSASNSILHTAATNVIPHGVGFGNLIVGFTGDTVSQEVLDLNGFNQQINGLVTPSNLAAAGIANTFIENDSLFYSPIGELPPFTTGSPATQVPANTAPAPAGVATGPSLATLTLGDNNQTATFSGIIRDTNTTTFATGTVGATSYTYVTSSASLGSNRLAITKIGTGIQTLTGSNSYTGDTNINNGALSVTGSLASSGNVFVNTSATAAGALYGTGSVGNVTLAAANGPNNAIINPGATGAASFGTLTTGSLKVGAGSDLQFDLQSAALGTSDSINATGTTTFNGSSTISPSGVPAAGDYIVLQSGGPITGNALALNSANDTRLTFAFAPSSWNPGTNAGSQQVVIRVTGQSAHLLWSGAADGSTWDLKTTQNWKNTDNANAQDKFFNGDFVTFDDTAAPNYGVSLGGTVQPGGITVNNSNGDYVISGGGGIAGVGALVKSGTRALTISTTNSFSGGTTLNAGTLNVNSNGALGTGALTINGGSLGNTSGQAVTLPANPTQTWNSDITFNGPNDLNLGTGAVTSTVTGGSVRTITVNGGTLTVGGIITDAAGTDGLTKAGPGKLVLGAANVFSGPVNINGGTVLVNNFGALGSSTNTTIASGATLDIGGIGTANVANGFNATAVMPFTIAGTGDGGVGAIINSGTNAQQNAFQSISLSADASVGGTGRFDIRGGTPVLNLNGHTLTKTGTNQFSLVGVTVNGGNVVVNQGVFSIEAATIIDNTVPTDTITVNPNATLQFFANTGTVSRPIVLNGQGTTINDASGANATSTIASTISAKGNLTFSGGTATANLIMNGAITESGGARSLTKTGASQLTLGAATNTYTGGTNINGGVVTFSALGSLGTGPLTFAGGTLQYGTTATGDVSALGITVNQGGGTIDTNNNVVALTHNITGPGGFGVRGNSTVLLTGTNTYAGPTTVQNGLLIFGSPGAIPSNTSLIMGDAAGDSATFDLNGHSLAVNGLSTVGNSGGSLTSNAAGNLTLTYNGTAPETFNASITNGSAQSLGLVLNSGNLTLGGSNSYTGTTQVNNHATLFLNGSHFTAGAYTIASGGTFGGIGSSDAAVTVASGATLSPGAASALGTLTVNSATIAGTLQIRINDADQSLNGTLTTNNALTLQSAALNFNITNGAFQPLYVLAHYGSLVGNPFASVVGLPANYTLNYNYQNLKEIALVSNFPAIQTGDFNRDGHTNATDIQTMMQALTDLKTYQATKSVSNAQLLQLGDFNADGAVNNLDLQGFLTYLQTPGNINVAPVPEPTGIALLGLGGLGLLAAYRRRRAVAKIEG
jgi:fibronectin-binding autotransporter adhesin